MVEIFVCKFGISILKFFYKVFSYVTKALLTNVIPVRSETVLSLASALQWKACKSTHFPINSNTYTSFASLGKFLEFTWVTINAIDCNYQIPWSRVLLEKLIVTRLSLHGIWRFITVHKIPHWPLGRKKNKPSKKPAQNQVASRAFTLVSCSAYFPTLKMEAICSSETSADFQRTTRRYIPEDITHNHRCKNLKYCEVHQHSECVRR
jgi:hypothetical protein